MGFCYREGCLKDANQKCSGCKINTYCSKACQNAAWPSHKMECEMNRILNEMQGKEDAEARTKPVKKPRTTHCTGCNVKFTDKEDEEIEPGDECPDCGYIACENCVCHHSKGSCYCENSNFARPYCKQVPAWYHMSSRTGKGYGGDRHPEEIEESDPGAFEKKARKCGNCGEIRKCLKKQYL